MLKRLKTLPLTIVLTVLIWMYAEAQFTTTRDNVRLSVKLVAPSPDLSIRVIDAEGVSRSLATIMVTLEGPKTAVDNIFQQSQESAMPDDDFNSLTYSVPAKIILAAAPDKMVDTAAMLNSLPYFRQRSVHITAAVPPRVKLDMDTMEHLTKAVDFRPSVAVSHYSLMPDEVTVNVPSRALQEIGGADRIRVIAVPQRELAALPPDSDQTVPVRFRVEYPGTPDERVTVGPVQGGTVTLRLPKRVGIMQIVPEVPVWVGGPPTMLAKYDVDLRTKFVKVAVAGSAASIELLKQRMAVAEESGAAIPAHGIRAFLDISPDDRAAEGYSTRRLRYVLPDGLTLQEAPAEVEFRLVERAAATQGK